MKTNNRITKNGAILIALFFLFQCSKRNGQLDERFKKISLSTAHSELLNGEKILANEIDAISVQVVDSFLIVELLKKKDWAFHVYNIQNLEFLGNLGRMGNGPSEFVRVRLSDQFIVSDSLVGIWLNDAGKRNFQFFDIPTSLNKEFNTTLFKRTYSTRFAMNQSLFAVDSLEWIGSIGPDATEYGRFIRYKTNNEIGEVVPYDVVIKNKGTLDNYNLYRILEHQIAIKPDRTRIVSLMTNLSRVSIFKFQPEFSLANTTVIKEEQYEDLDANVFLNEPENVTHHYMDVAVSDNYIYALFHGQSRLKYSREITSTEIRVFDWSGELIKIFNIPDYLLTLSVDENNGFMYGVSFFEEKIMRYSFNYDDLGKP